jgi:hypothetical protein
MKPNTVSLHQQVKPKPVSTHEPNALRLEFGLFYANEGQSCMMSQSPLGQRSHINRHWTPQDRLLYITCANPSNDPFP